MSTPCTDLHGFAHLERKILHGMWRFPHIAAISAGLSAPVVEPRAPSVKAFARTSMTPAMVPPPALDARLRAAVAAALATLAAVVVALLLTAGHREPEPGAS